MARQIKILKTGDKYLLDGTQDWANPCSVDLIAHDIFHHDPSDDGSMSCELMSFGAEAWIEHHTDDLRLGVSYEALSAILEDMAETSDTSKHASLIADDAKPFVAVEERFRDRFVSVITSAVTESGMSDSLAHLSDEFVSNMCSDENIGRYADWMCVGFNRAQERFPDPEATRTLFNSVVRALRRWDAQDGDSLILSIDEKHSRIGSSNPDIEDFFRNSGCDVVPYSKSPRP